MIIECMCFLGIYLNNMDEFFCVCVVDVKCWILFNKIFDVNFEEDEILFY